MKRLAAALAVVVAFPLAWAADPTPAPKAPAAQPAAPKAPAAAPAAAPSTLKGKVLEVKDVDAYTYLRLKTANGETWAAVGKAPVKVGSEVTIYEPMLMQNFESKTLKRKFDTIVFGSLKAPQAQTQAQAGGAMSTASPHTMVPGGAAAGAAGGAGGMDMGAMHAGMGQAQPPADVKIAKVAKAEGATGRTVAEVNSERAALKDKPVAIRATVVKVTPAVMGKNWIHLRDGTGAAGDGSNDILVTSKDEPKLGDVVVAKGVVKTDVNLGSGYAYKVLVEDASFGK